MIILLLRVFRSVTDLSNFQFENQTTWLGLVNNLSFDYLRWFKLDQKFDRTHQKYILVLFLSK